MYIKKTTFLILINLYIFAKLAKTIFIINQKKYFFEVKY